MEDMEQSALHCATCGGQCSFSPEQRALVCLSCGTVYDLATPQDYRARDEFVYRGGSESEDIPLLYSRHAHQCRNCGGEVIFTGITL
jgi:predicted RNA-binding Zn-ribbon protein involved in translation (DUF1610 family)